MKKVLVLLLALAAVGGAFAQTPALTFGMYGDITATAATNDSYSVYTETYLAYKAKDMGFAATIIGGNQLQVNSTGVGIQTIETTPKPVDGLTTRSAFDIFAAPRNYKFWYQVCSAAKVSAGVLREGPARLTSFIDGNGFSTRMANVEAGILTEMTILPVLSAAVFVPVTGVASEKGVTAKLVAPLDDLKNSALGASFGIPNVATLVAAYRFNGKEASVGVDVKAVKNVTIKAGVQNTGALGATTNVYATAGTTMGALKVGLDSAIAIKPAAKYNVQGMAEYTLGSYVLGAKLFLDNTASILWYKNDGLLVKAYVKRNFAAGDIKAGVTYNAKAATVSFPVDFELSF